MVEHELSFSTPRFNLTVDWRVVPQEINLKMLLLKLLMQLQLFVLHTAEWPAINTLLVHMQLEPFS